MSTSQQATVKTTTGGNKTVRTTIDSAIEVPALLRLEYVVSLCMDPACQCFGAVNYLRFAICLCSLQFVCFSSEWPLDTYDIPAYALVLRRLHHSVFMLNPTRLSQKNIRVITLQFDAPPPSQSGKRAAHRPSALLESFNLDDHSRDPVAAFWITLS